MPPTATSSRSPYAGNRPPGSRAATLRRHETGQRGSTTTGQPARGNTEPTARQNNNRPHLPRRRKAGRNGSTKAESPHCPPPEHMPKGRAKASGKGAEIRQPLAAVAGFFCGPRKAPSLSGNSPRHKMYRERPNTPHHALPAARHLRARPHRNLTATSPPAASAALLSVSAKNSAGRRPHHFFCLSLLPKTR